MPKYNHLLKDSKENRRIAKITYNYRKVRLIEKAIESEMS